MEQNPIRSYVLRGEFDLYGKPNGTPIWFVFIQYEGQSQYHPDAVANWNFNCSNFLFFLGLEWLIHSSGFFFFLGVGLIKGFF